MKSKQKKPSLAAQRIRLAISVAQRRHHGRAATNAPSTSSSHQLTVSPRQSIASPRRRKLASHSNAPSTSRSQQYVESPSPPHTITASWRLHVTPSELILFSDSSRFKYINSEFRFYKTWFAHGESLAPQAGLHVPHNNVHHIEIEDLQLENENHYRDMVIDAIDPEFRQNSIKEVPNSQAEKFFQLLRYAAEPLWDGCEKHTRLSAVSQLMNCKSEYNISESCYNRICSIIHACPNDCMLYWKEDAKKKKCDICGHARFKKGRKGRGKHKEVPYKVLRYLPLTPRLQRLFMSSKYAEHMSWHKKGRPEGVLTHPSDGEAWKHLDRSDPSFAEDARNVRLSAVSQLMMNLKRKARNKACIEGSICEAYLIQETSNFCSLYFKSHVQTKLNRVPRNDDGGYVGQNNKLNIFNYPCRPSGKATERLLDENEYKAAQRYVLLNCEEIVPFVKDFDNLMMANNPTLTDGELDKLRDIEFSKWVKTKVRQDRKANERIRDLCNGPSKFATCYDICFVNGYKFHTKDYGEHKATINSGVSILTLPSTIVLVDFDLDQVVTLPSTEVEEVRGESRYYCSRGRGVHRATKPDRVTRNQSTPTQSHHSMSPIADSSRVFEASEEVRGGSQYCGSRGRGVHRATKPDRVTRNQSTTTQSHHSMSPIADSSRVFEASEEVPDTRDQESSTRKRGPRGANLNKNILANSSQRKVIHISGLNYLEHEVVRAITKDFKALFYGEETQWHKLDKDLVEIFYKSFQDRYQYEDNVDPETARLVWEERAKLRFSGLWVLVRKHCKKKTGSTNPAHWRLVCPEFVNEEDWDGILASWMTEKWKKRSAAGVANRKKVPGDEDGSYVRHTGGCVSFEIHRTRWETELRIEMTDIEFFEKLHKKDKGKGTWCDLRAERAAAKYREIVMKKETTKDMDMGIQTKQERICRKAKRTKRLRAYNSRRSDEAWIESEVSARVEKRMEAFEVDMQQRVQEQVQVQV
ncbi:GRAS protein [Tanacetum coccineum]